MVNEKRDSFRKQTQKPNKSPPIFTRSNKKQLSVQIKQKDLPDKVLSMLWDLLRLIFTNMYKDLEKVELSMTPEYIQKLQQYFSHSNAHIRKLSLLVVVVRLKFQKKFRRRWIHTFPQSLNNKRILLGKMWQNSSYNPSLIDSDGLDYTQATLFYQMNSFYKIKDFDECSLGKIIGTRILLQVPDPLNCYVWFDRLVNKKIEYSLKGKPLEDMTFNSLVTDSRSIDNWKKRVIRKNSISENKSSFSVNMKRLSQYSRSGISACCKQKKTEINPKKSSKFVDSKFKKSSIQNSQSGINDSKKCHHNNNHINKEESLCLGKTRLQSQVIIKNRRQRSRSRKRSDSQNGKTKITGNTRSPVKRPLFFKKGVDRKIRCSVKTKRKISDEFLSDILTSKNQYIKHQRKSSVDEQSIHSPLKKFRINKAIHVGRKGRRCQTPDHFVSKIRRRLIS